MTQQNRRSIFSLRTAIHLGFAATSLAFAGAASAQGLAGAVPIVYGSGWADQQRALAAHAVAPADGQSKTGQPAAGGKTAQGNANRIGS
jgi:hypothetical protein